MAPSNPTHLPPGSMPGTFTPEDVAFAVEALGRHLSESDVCRLLCEERGLAWLNAQAAVAYAQQSQGLQIARRQSPLLITIGVFTVLAGIALMIAFGAELLAFLNDPPNTRFERRQMTNAIMLCGLGVAMLLGGGAGTIAVLRSLAPKR